MKRFTAAALSIVLSVGVSAGVAQAQDFSDPATIILLYLDSFN